MPRIETPWGPWEPAPLNEVVALFQGLAVPWWVSGGYAIEQAVGRAYREHADVDITVLRRDQQAVRALLAEWDVHAADPPGLRPWPMDEVLPGHVHDIWVREHPGGPWRFQLMLDEADGEMWVYRRDRRIRRPLSTMTTTDNNGVAWIAPEVQLLFKAKSPRLKDELDFTEVLPVLDGVRRRWLDEALTVEYGDHPWRERLRS